jgi:hypothetical protein
MLLSYPKYTTQTGPRQTKSQKILEKVVVPNVVPFLFSGRENGTNFVPTPSEGRSQIEGAF